MDEGGGPERHFQRGSERERERLWAVSLSDGTAGDYARGKPVESWIKLKVKMESQRKTSESRASSQTLFKVWGNLASLWLILRCYDCLAWYSFIQSLCDWSDFEKKEENKSSNNILIVILSIPQHKTWFRYICINACIILVRCCTVNDNYALVLWSYIKHISEKCLHIGHKFCNALHNLCSYCYCITTLWCVFPNIATPLMWCMQYRHTAVRKKKNMLYLPCIKLYNIK